MSQKAIISILSLILLFSPTTALAQDWEDGRCVYDGVATIRGIECLLERVFTYIVGFVAIAVLVMIVVGGYKLLTSGGDPKGVEGGKNVITYAIIGLVIALLSVFIINFIAEFTGADEITRLELDVD